MENLNENLASKYIKLKFESRFNTAKKILELTPYSKCYMFLKKKEKGQNGKSK